MIDTENRIWTDEQKKEWETLIEQMEKTELKPCPFCGKKPRIDDDCEETGTFAGIKCVKNFFFISCTCGVYKTANHTKEGLESLIKWWNTRSTEKSEDTNGK